MTSDAGHLQSWKVWLHTLSLHQILPQTDPGSGLHRSDQKPGQTEYQIFSKDSEQCGLHRLHLHWFRFRLPFHPCWRYASRPSHYPYGGYHAWWHRNMPEIPDPDGSELHPAFGCVPFWSHGQIPLPFCRALHEVWAVLFSDSEEVWVKSSCQLSE